MMTIEDIIRKAKAKRKERGLVQKELAYKLGVAVNTVINWEKGRNKPYGESVVKLILFINEGGSDK